MPFRLYDELDFTEQWSVHGHQSPYPTVVVTGPGIYDLIEDPYKRKYNFFRGHWTAGDSNASNAFALTQSQVTAVGYIDWTRFPTIPDSAFITKAYVVGHFTINNSVDGILSGGVQYAKTYAEVGMYGGTAHTEGNQVFTSLDTTIVLPTEWRFPDPGEETTGLLRSLDYDVTFIDDPLHELGIRFSAFKENFQAIIVEAICHGGNPMGGLTSASYSFNHDAWSMTLEYEEAPYQYWIPDPAKFTPVSPDDPTSPLKDACGVVTAPEDDQLVIADVPPSDDYIEVVDPPVPNILTIIPPAGPHTGGQSVTIKGTSFSAGATVSFGGVDATDVVIVTSKQIQCTTPAHDPGEIAVVVTNADGTSSV
jgi:IPT/TIG domain